MLLPPEPVKAECFEYIITEAKNGGVIVGPWSDELQTALEALAAHQSQKYLNAARVALAHWVTEWNDFVAG